VALTRWPICFADWLVARDKREAVLMHEATALQTRAHSATLARAYLQLTKPGIAVFVAMSALAGYVVNASRSFEPALLVLVFAATTLMSGGAATLNQVAERHLDARMRRTARRPLPAGVITPAAATTFGWALSLAGALIACFALNPLALLFLVACHFSYLHLYTPLKRTTALCTLVGGIPGALPVLAGAAAAGTFPNGAALALTGLLFMWQMPHFFAIGWLVREDYARAGFALLPVRDETGKRTARVSLVFALATQGCAILVAREAGLGPLLTAVVHTAGTLYWISVLPFLRCAGKAQARRLFFTSLLVLPAILIPLLVKHLWFAATV
jgi:protoheme IX farnesyltransferase